LHYRSNGCREAEREWLGFASEEETNPHAGIFINRLSDYLFRTCSVGQSSKIRVGGTSI